MTETISTENKERDEKLLKIGKQLYDLGVKSIGGSALAKSLVRVAESAEKTLADKKGKDDDPMKLDAATIKKVARKSCTSVLGEDNEKLPTAGSIKGIIQKLVVYQAVLASKEAAAKPAKSSEPPKTEQPKTENPEKIAA